MHERVNNVDRINILSYYYCWHYYKQKPREESKLRNIINNHATEKQFSFKVEKNIEVLKKMGSCFEFFLSLKFGKMAKSLVWWTHNNEALPPPSKSRKSICR